MKKELQQIESGIDFYVINPCAFQLLQWKDDILVTLVYCFLFFHLLTFQASFSASGVTKTSIYTYFISFNMGTNAYK